MDKTGFAFVRKNYILMGISFLIILIGFLLMISGSTTEKEFNASVLDAQRIIVAPTITLIGFLLMVYAILYKAKSKNLDEKK